MNSNSVCSRSYSFIEFIDLMNEIDEGEAMLFKVYCKDVHNSTYQAYCRKRGNSMRKIMQFVHTVLVEMDNAFDRINELDLEDTGVWFNINIYDCRDNNNGIIAPKGGWYFPTRLYYSCKSAGHIEVTADTVNATMDLVRNSECYIAFLKYLILNSNRLLKDTKALADLIISKYRAFEESKEIPNWVSCENICKDLLFNQECGFNTTVVTMRSKGFTYEQILTAMQRILGEVKITR